MRPLLPRVREIKHHAVEQDMLLSFPLFPTSITAFPQQGFLQPGGVYRVDDLLSVARFGSNPQQTVTAGSVSGSTTRTGASSRSVHPFGDGGRQMLQHRLWEHTVIRVLLVALLLSRPKNGWSFAACSLKG